MENDKNLFPFEQAYPFQFSDCISHFEDIWKLDVNAQSVTILTHCASLLDNRIAVVSHGIPQKPILWACIIQESGTGKSAILERHCDFLQERNLELEEPEIAYETTNATYEAIEKFSINNNKGIMLSIDEFETLVKGMDNYNSNGNKGNYNRTWNGKPMTPIRKGEGKVKVKDNKINIMAFTQPDMMHQLINRSDFSNGFASRFLYSTLYDTGMRLRNNKKVKDRYSEKLNLIYQRIWDIKPMKFTFSESADKEYTRWYNDLYTKHHPYTLLRKYCGKIETYGLRIACVLHCMEWGANGGDKPEAEIPKYIIEKTTLILEFFMQQYQEMIDARSYDFSKQILDEQKITFQKVYYGLSDSKGYDYKELMNLFDGTYSKRSLNDKFQPKSRMFVMNGTKYIKSIINE